MPATWIETATSRPPDGKVVNTKIDDANGCRNEQTLKRIGNLWFYPDGSMYVYYVPTHWSELADAKPDVAEHAPDSYTSVDGDLRRNYREDPKSW